MPAVSRKDRDHAGGVIIEGSPDVFANNYKMGRKGDQVAPHPSGGRHRGPVLQRHSPDVFANNIYISRRNDVATCGHPVMMGSPDVFANGP